MAIAQAVISRLVQRIGDQLDREVRLSPKERDLVEWVEEEFRWMEFFLKDLAAIAHADERAKRWLRDVTDAAYRAEDIIDVFVLEIAPLRRRRGQGCLGTISRYASIFSDQMARRKLLLEIQSLKVRLQAISGSRETHGIQFVRGENPHRTRVRERSSSPFFMEEDDVVGLDEDAEILTQLLTEGDQPRCVVGIVGTGGSGKTTLAQKVYRSAAVVACFGTRAWISVSPVYVVRDLLQALCKQLSPEDFRELERMNNSDLRRMIHQCLDGKKYLILLDDIWNPEAWDALQNAFPDTNGSRILLTTRNKDIALHSDFRCKPYALRLLTESQSWELFSKRVFFGGGVPPELEESGRQIVRECRGFPLAILFIGGLLSTVHPTISDWMKVYDNIHSYLIQGESGISETPSLSYEDLPNDLKPCFLYLGTFPEDYEFRPKKLVKLWAAEGFLHQRGNETLEEVGQGFLKVLIQRSLVHVTRRGSTGAVKSCRIYGLSQDLCISNAKEEGFLEIGRNGSHADVDAPRSSRRIAVHHNSGRYNSFNYLAQNLRSILIHGQDGERLDRREETLLMGSFKLLRVLDINQAPVNNLPSEIGELVHLGYLGFTGCSLRSLPLSIGNLINLQTLLVESDKDVKIPSTMGKMKKLRHLQIKGSSLGVMDAQPRLHHTSSNLYTLSNVWAGKWLYNDCLKGMKNLRKLGICLYSKERQFVGEEEWESIVKLESLESLFVSSVKQIGNKENLLRLVSLNHLTRLFKLRLLGSFAKPLNCSFFPPCLAKLSLKLSYLKRDPLPKLEKLQNLRVLELLSFSYVGEKMVCSAGGFPGLQSFRVEGLNSLEEWIVEGGSMPRLSNLGISKCQQLKSIPEGLQYVTTLGMLKLNAMPETFYNRIESNEGEDWYKVRHIRSICREP